MLPQPLHTIYGLQLHTETGEVICASPRRVNEFTSQVDVERGCKNFFSAKFGKRETYSYHRGFIICRCTVQHTGCKPQRKTTVYLYDIDANDTMCVSTGGVALSSVKQAERFIDRIIERGWYTFGDRQPGSVPFEVFEEAIKGR